MKDNELKKKLWYVNKEFATLRFEYSQLLVNNRMLAMKLFGYRATSPENFPDEIVKRMEYYLHVGKE